MRQSSGDPLERARTEPNVGVRAIGTSDPAAYSAQRGWLYVRTPNRVTAILAGLRGLTGSRWPLTPGFACDIFALEYIGGADGPPSG